MAWRLRTATARTAPLPRPFKIVLIGESFSLFGTQISLVMIPLIAVLTLDAGEFSLGLISAFGWLPIILFGLVAGSVVDRISRWWLMVICNVVRALLIALIPTLALTDTLTLSALIAVSFGVGICNVFFDIAYQTYVPELVTAQSLGKANSAFEFIRSASQLTGPLLGGALAATYPPEFTVSINSVTFVIAFLALLLLPARFRTPARANSAVEHSHRWRFKPLLADIRAGLVHVWRSPQIRIVVIAGALSNIFTAGIAALFALFVTQTLGLDPAVFGFIIALSGAGALLGALTYRYWAAWLHDGACVAIGLASMTMGTVLVAYSAITAAPILVVSLGQILIGYGTPVINIALVTLRQRLTPSGLLGRVNASARVAIMSSLPAGALIISGLAELSSTSLAFWIAAAGQLVILLTLGPMILRLKVDE